MMFLRISSLVLSLAVLGDSAAITPLIKRNDTSLASLPQNDPNSTARAQEVFTKRAGWTYGTPLIGNTSYFPNGTLATIRVDSDLVALEIDNIYINASINAGIVDVEEAIELNGGLNTLEDYATVLYVNEWAAAIPSGEDPGMLTNYTQDLLFSMARLSLNPIPLHRAKPGDTLPFTVDDSIVQNVTGLSLSDLQSSGRLFIVDHSDQLNYPRSSVRFGAACTAYFFIHPESGDFLPLAIKTNYGSDLTYTPLDSANDWLLAKMMFNVNDVFHAEMYHLIATHDVGEIVHQAAERTLSDSHPIMVLLDRLMTQAYGVRIAGSTLLFDTGGGIDQAFATTSTGTKQWMTDTYPQAGKYQSNYLNTLFESQGLVNSTDGPSFSWFPFRDDAEEILGTMRAFMTAFVEAYYPSQADIAGDYELQAWFEECAAGGAAGVFDFPTAEQLNGNEGKAVLVEVLTHFQYLTGILHPALNTGSLVTEWTLPLVPLALYSEVPAEKGVESVIPWLPPADGAVFQLDLLATFNRPQYASQNKTLVFAFSDSAFLSRLNDEANKAASTFTEGMGKISERIQARRFDNEGLSQGMPFVWKGLDPGTVPFFFAI